MLQPLEALEGKYKVLLLTQHFDEQIIDAAYHHGARGFLHKNCTVHDLKFAIDNIVKSDFKLNRKRKQSAYRNHTTK